MKVLLLSILCSLFFLTDSEAQVPGIVWQKCYGGSAGAGAFQIMESNDNGFIFCGYTASNDGDVSGNHGGADAWVVKLDSSGNLQWQKCFGGPGTELFNSIAITNDGGYIAAGYTTSNGGDVSGYLGGNSDFWVVKFDSIGNLQWQKCLGGSSAEQARGIIANGSGYIIGGFTTSGNINVSGNHGLQDFWIVGLDFTGNFLWQKCLGGSSEDELYSFNKTNDGGYALAGSSSSNDGDLTNNKGAFDCWIVITNSVGNLQSQRNYGGTQGEYFNSIFCFQDGLIAIGETSSNDVNVSGNHGGGDGWVLRTDSIGNIINSKCIGGSAPDQKGHIMIDSVGGFIMIMDAASTNGDASGNHGGFDFWVVKMDDSLNIEWQKCFGGSAYETNSNLIQIQDGYVLCGITFSNDGDVSGGGFHGLADAWVIKLSNSTTDILPLDNLLINLSSFIISNKLHLNFTDSFSHVIPLQLFDITGRLLFEKTIETVPGKNELALPIGEVKPGVYLLRMGNEVCKVIAN